ncbi:Molybdopterin-synthase sulfurtransferase [Phycomyces blakesleeanus]|uniref:Molybdopterin-synthase sulfurtransferase n=1 Tax=Phycomyces blakesleeanus TaxID=4837 RepID=A0ABR3B454_PHYBL
MTSLAEENARLRKRIAELEAQLGPAPQSAKGSFKKVDALSKEEILRFGRQLILPDFGIAKQLKLRNTTILVVGAGGLGAPAILYLGANGVGRLGIADPDTVAVNNLHRQVIHTEASTDTSKAESAMRAVHAIDSTCEVVTYPFALTSENALEIIREYDIVIDATDNIGARYLLSDACVLANKPLVSGSALRMDGQLTVYHHNNGPCYRCLHPVPPPIDTVSKCVESGVLGVIPGVIGTLQALEAIKVAVGLHNDDPSFLIFSGLTTPMFRTMKLRGRKKDCIACGDNPSLTDLIDYAEFCGTADSDKSQDLFLLAPHERIKACEYDAHVRQQKPSLLLDVRPPVQYDICRLPESHSVPIDEFENKIMDIKKSMSELDVAGDQVFVVCRLGNDSQLAVRLLEKHGIKGARDLVGGLYSWSMNVDPSFPIY